MGQARSGLFFTSSRAADARIETTGTDSIAGIAARRRVLVELQWQGGGGRFRHIVLRPTGLRRTLGAVGIVAVCTLVVAAASLARPQRAPAPDDLDALVRESIDLRSQHDALRERARILGERIYEAVELQSSMLDMAHRSRWADQPACPLPPARDAEINSILDWLREQSARLGALEDELPGGRADLPVSLACISHRVSSRGRRGAVPGWVFDSTGAQATSAGRRAPGDEKALPGAVDRRPQQEAGEIYRLVSAPPSGAGTGPRRTDTALRVAEMRPGG